MNAKTFIIDLIIGLCIGAAVTIGYQAPLAADEMAGFQIEKVFSVKDSHGSIHICEPLNLYMAANQNGASTDIGLDTVSKWHCYMDKNEDSLFNVDVIGVSAEDDQYQEREIYDI